MHQKGKYMDYDKKNQIATERGYKVIKANEIIQKAKFDLGLLEQKTFCYAVSKIKPNDAPNTWYSFTINEYCEVCGISKNNGKNIDDVKTALKQLRDKSFYLLNMDGDYETVGWLDKAIVSPKSGKVKIRFDETLQKYIVGLYENYTQYSLLCVLPMRSTYSIRLYELLKSYVGLKRKEMQFEINDLKTKLNAPYVNFKDFRNRAIEPATKEINQYTDIEITWEPVKKGRKVVAVKFTMKDRGSWGAYINARKAAETLDGQMEFNQEGTITEFQSGARKK
jgi:plasmid replication initiation protein